MSNLLKQILPIKNKLAKKTTTRKQLAKKNEKEFLFLSHISGSR